LAAFIAIVEFLGPCRFSHWATEADATDYVSLGDPVGKDHPAAWIQVAAVSIVQTQNTMRLLPAMLSEKLRRDHGIRKTDVGKEIIYAYGGRRQIQAVTSSPRTLEGGRPTFIIKNETHHWLTNNEGHEMAAVIDRNATKSRDGAARDLSITNAYDPAENSVAQQERESWEAEHAGLSIGTGVLYDSIEWDAEITLRPPKTADYGEPSDEEVKAWIAALVDAVRGDASWLDVEGITKSILDRRNPVSRSRRFWLNTVDSAEDAWAAAASIKAATAPWVIRDADHDPLRAGWLVLPDEPVVLFGDGSKSDDATALVGCRLSDGYVFTVGVWQKPPGKRGEAWLAPRSEVAARVKEAMDRFNVVAFWFDPSHTKDDEDGSRYWDGILDEMHRTYRERLQLWAVKNGDRQHAIMWDMTSPERSALFVGAAETFIEELEHRGEDGEPVPTFLHDGHPALVQHMRNGKRYPTRWGVSLWKGHRESDKKVDLAVCAVGARMLRRILLNKGLEEETQVGKGILWGG
jgi:hypothetical protein